MTLNDLERRNSPYFAYFSPNSIALQVDHVIVVEARLIMSVKYCLPIPVFHFWPKLTPPAARSICDSWTSCLIMYHSWYFQCPYVMHSDQDLSKIAYLNANVPVGHSWFKVSCSCTVIWYSCRVSIDVPRGTSTKPVMPLHNRRHNSWKYTAHSW